MFGSHQENHPSIFLLADHLDAILAAGEDLMALRLDVSAAGRLRAASDAAAMQATLDGFIREVGVLEISLAAHLRQARERAREVARADQRFASLIRLFLGGTAMLSDALAEFMNPGTFKFDRGNDPIAYLRSRGIIGDDAAGIYELAQLQPGDDMKIGGKIELGPLLEMVSAFLNSLDVAYELYPVDSAPTPSTMTPVTTSQSLADMAKQMQDRAPH